MTIDIIFEDNHLLVVNKPANLPVQGDSSGDADMLTLLKSDLKERYNKTGNVFLGLVHRLDRPVGGVMVFAKTSKAASRLSEQIRTRSFKKTYTALVQGKPSEAEATLAHFLQKNTKNNTAIVSKTAKKDFKAAELCYRALALRGDSALLEIDLKTGRHHQIRAQLAFVRHPIVGDFKYGFKPERTAEPWNAKQRGIALRATKLCFVHPTTKEKLCFEIEAGL